VRVRSILITLISNLRLTVSRVRFLFVCVIALLIMTLLIYQSFWERNRLVLSDLVHALAISVLAVTLGWLGFSNSGRTLLLEGNQKQRDPRGLTKLIKALAASWAMALISVVVIILLMILLDRPDLITSSSFSLGLYLFCILCFPLVYKWIK